MKNENELNENEMSLTNMPAIIVPTPLPLVRAEDVDISTITDEALTPTIKL